MIPSVTCRCGGLIAENCSGTISILNTSRRKCIPEVGTTLSTLKVSRGELSYIVVRVIHLMESNRAVGLSGHSKGTVALAALLSRVPVSTTEFFFGLHRPGSRFSFSLSLTTRRADRGPICCIRCTRTEVYSVLGGTRDDNVALHAPASRRLSLLGSPRRARLVHRLSSLASRIVATTGACSPTEVARFIVRLTALFRGFCGTREIVTSSRKLVRTHLCLYITMGSAVGGVLAVLGVSTPRDVWRWWGRVGNRRG